MMKSQILLNYPAEKGGSTVLKNIQDSARLNNLFFLFVNFMELHEPYVKYEWDHWSSSLEDLFGVKAIPQFDILQRLGTVIILRQNNWILYLED